MKPIVSGYCKKLKRDISYTPDGLIETTHHGSTEREFILSGLFECPEYGDHVQECRYLSTCNVAENYQNQR